MKRIIAVAVAATFALGIGASSASAAPVKVDRKLVVVTEKERSVTFEKER